MPIANGWNRTPDQPGAAAIAHSSSGRVGFRYAADRSAQQFDTNLVWRSKFTVARSKTPDPSRDRIVAATRGDIEKAGFNVVDTPDTA